MIIVKLWGGLGNQMFQYAFGRCLAFRHNTELKLDLNFFNNQIAGKKGQVLRNYDLDIYNINSISATTEEIFKLGRRFKIEFFDKGVNKIFGYKSSYIAEPHFHFSDAAYHSPDNVYLSGYWQTEKYFSEITSLIRADFTFKDKMSDTASELLNWITNTNSVCVNVRRGDFVTNNFHGSYGFDYFKKAESIMNEKTTNQTYFIFSDEIEWCQQNLKFEGETVFVSHEYAGRKFQDYLRLMSSCNHFIIPNSSFAWWAVWFNMNKDKIVVAPQLWFNDTSFNTSDLTPASWIRV